MTRHALVFLVLVSGFTPDSGATVEMSHVLRARYSIERVGFAKSFPVESQHILLPHLAMVDRELGRVWKEHPRVASFFAAHPLKSYVISSDLIAIKGVDYSGEYVSQSITVCIYHRPDDLVLNTVRHEIGHHVYMAGDGLVDREDWQKFFAEMGEDWWKEHVSDYAATNEREAFAECFSTFTDADYKPDWLPAVLDAWLREATGATH